MLNRHAYHRTSSQTCALSYAHSYRSTPPRPLVMLKAVVTLPNRKSLLCLQSSPSWENLSTSLIGSGPFSESLHHKLHITESALQDVLWWLHFGQTWNGAAFFLDPAWTPAHNLQIYTDASSTLGYGAYWNGAWFSTPWPSHLAHHSIEWKELYAVVMACEVWGTHWSCRRMLFHCDNQAIVHIWESGLSRSTELMDLVRALFFVAANNNFTVLIRHVPGIDNSIADALSRLQLQRFRHLAPHADPAPTPTPANLMYTSINV